MGSLVAQIAYPGLSLKLWLLGDLLGAVAYGIVLSLVVAYLSYPLTNANVRSSKQNRTTSKVGIVNASHPSLTMISSRYRIVFEHILFYMLSSWFL